MKYIKENKNKFINNNSVINKFLNYTDKIDRQLSKPIHNSKLNDNIEHVLFIFGRMFSPEFIAAYITLLGLISLIKYHNIYLIVRPLINVLLGLVLVIFIKKIIGRPRPNFNPIKKYQLRKRETNCSMPSGDSFQAALFATMLLNDFNCYYGFILVPFVMYARIYFNCHFLFDTIIGALIGIFFTIVLNSFLKILFNNYFI